MRRLLIAIAMVMLSGSLMAQGEMPQGNNERKGNKIGDDYSSNTSSTIIRAKPTAKRMVLKFVCCPLVASGISSSTTT